MASKEKQSTLWNDNCRYLGNDSMSKSENGEVERRSSFAGMGMLSFSKKRQMASKEKHCTLWTDIFRYMGNDSMSK